MPSSPIAVIPEQVQKGQTFERRGADSQLRSRINEKKSTLPAVHPPQRKQKDEVKVAKVLSPKTPKSILNRQKQLVLANRRSLHFAHDVLLMGQFFGGVLATVLIAYGTGAGFVAFFVDSYVNHPSGGGLLWANTGVAVLLLGALFYAYKRFVRPTEYLIHAGLSFVGAVQRSVLKAQESEGKTPLELPVPHPNHPIAYLRTAYVAHVVGYMRFVLFTPPVLLFAAALSVLGTASIHNNWYMWMIGACFATMSSLWFITVWALYIWMKRQARRTSSQTSAFLTEFLTTAKKTDEKKTDDARAE